MNGLEAIIERILEDAKLSADQINDRADKQAKQIYEEGRAEAEQIISDAKLQAEQNTESKVNRAQSMAAMTKRKGALHARQSVIDQVIKDAVMYLRNLSAEEKVDVYTNILRAQDNQAAKAEVQFAKGDENLASQVLNAFAGRYVKTEKPGDFTGGLIIKRGRVEDNLTFDLLVKNYRSDLIKEASDLLFNKKDASDSETDVSDKEVTQS